MIRFVTLSRQRTRLTRGLTSWLLLLAVLLASSEFASCVQTARTVASPSGVSTLEPLQHDHAGSHQQLEDHGQHCALCVVPALAMLSHGFTLRARLPLDRLRPDANSVHPEPAVVGGFRARAPPRLA